MSPEYAMEGRFSEKADVFSLGVLLLEIISGRKNNSFKEHESLSLLSYVCYLPQILLEDFVCLSFVCYFINDHIFLYTLAVNTFILMFFQAWRLWNENNILSLIDATVSDPHFKDQILKCIKLSITNKDKVAYI